VRTCESHGGRRELTADDETEHATDDLDSQGEGSDVDKDQATGDFRLDVGEDGALDGGTVRDGLIGVDGVVGLLRGAKEIKTELLSCEETRGRRTLSKNSETSFWTRGIRVDPPTRTISWISSLSIPKSLRTFCTGATVFLKRSAQSSSNEAREMAEALW
jgi:hypothetical protein